MNGFEICLRILGVFADIVTVAVVVSNIIIVLKNKKYFSNSDYDCSINYFFDYSDIPKRFKVFEGGGESLDGTIFFLDYEDSVGINYTFFSPKGSAIMKNVKIYVIDLPSIGNDSIKLSTNYKKVQHYKTMKKTLCINLSPGDCFPGFLVEWRDYHGKHRYYSNTHEVLNRFDKDIVYWWGENY